MPCLLLCLLGGVFVWFGWLGFCLVSFVFWDLLFVLVLDEKNSVLLFWNVNFILKKNFETRRLK